MSINEGLERRGSHTYLEGLQRAAYAQLGYAAPTFTAEELRQRDAENLDALREGGEYDKALQEKALNPEQRRSALENLRRGTQQVSAHQDLERILKEYSDAPTPHVDPFHHAILKRLQSQIEALSVKFPKLSFSGEIQKLIGRVTVSTLPTGQVNARTLAVPRTDEYVIVVDPVFFDFLYNMSNNFALAIDSEKARAGAKRYAESGQERPLSEAIRFGDSTIAKAFFSTVWAFFGRGLPPPPFPYDEKAFDLAEHLRNTGALFVLAHEYAHILLKHVRPSGGADVRSVHGGPESEEWRQELEADWLACAICDASLTAQARPPPVRFMGCHFFFISSVIVELGLVVLESGKSGSVMDLIPKDASKLGLTHPVATLRLAQVNQWLKMKYPPFDERGTQYFAALLLEVADALWRSVEPHVFRMREQGCKPAPMWTGFDVFENP